MKKLKRYESFIGESIEHEDKARMEQHEQDIFYVLLELGEDPKKEYSVPERAIEGWSIERESSNRISREEIAAASGRLGEFGLGCIVGKLEGFKSRHYIAVMSQEELDFHERSARETLESLAKMAGLPEKDVKVEARTGFSDHTVEETLIGADSFVEWALEEHPQCIGFFGNFEASTVFASFPQTNTFMVNIKMNERRNMFNKISCSYEYSYKTGSGHAYLFDAGRTFEDSLHLGESRWTWFKFFSIYDPIEVMERLAVESLRNNCLKKHGGGSRI